MLVWATGGAPRGKPKNAPPPVTLHTGWPSGAPDLALRDAGAVHARGHAPTRRRTRSTLPLAGAAGKSLRAVDLKPGTPAIVRSATLLLKSGAAAPKELASVGARAKTPAVALTAPLRVPDGASLVARIVYKRTWKYEGQPLSDASTVGLYFADAAARRPTGRPR